MEVLVRMMELVQKMFLGKLFEWYRQQLASSSKKVHMYIPTLSPVDQRQISHNLSHGNWFFKPCWKVHKQLQMRFRALALHFPMTEGQPLKHQLCYSLWWPNYVITSVDNTKLPYYTWHSTTVSLETYPLYLLIIFIWSILLKLL